MFVFSRQKRREREIARRLYDQVVGQARSPSFYVDGGVPDTVDGRFEMVVLHAYLVIGRLMAGEDAAQRIAQYLFDTMITDMDRSLREMGIGDLSVGRKVKAMAEAYYGRSRAYDSALATSDADLSSALRRNVFGTIPSESETKNAVVDGMTRYVTATLRRLREQPVEAIADGRVRFVDYSLISSDSERFHR
ncbi:MAG: hypothetical protein J4F40_16660 [Alphaproteobacteria bacterium]|nr:hypothetical protein [Alphaproteobacteria bacterium]